MSDNVANNPKPRLETIRQLLEKRGQREPVKSIGEYLSVIHEFSEGWQEEDWKATECDEDILLNNVRIVGQLWFRGHINCDLSLRPGLYREMTRKYLLKQPGSPTPIENQEASLLGELFELEHELRIDFTSYGHLLNETNQAKTDTDWYFLMQHHGIPTRLLDWTTNALAALFFSLDEYRDRRERSNRPEPPTSVCLGIWMTDAYWLADHLSDVWGSPLLAWSSDAIRYIPPLETLIDKMGDSKALLPDHAMPIEPPAMHPRVAAQEGRFIIFGRTQDLLDEKIRLEPREDCSGIEELRLAQIKFEVNDVDALLRDLAQLGISKRTLFPDLAGLADFVRWKHFHGVSSYMAKC
jgi:FRG domain